MNSSVRNIHAGPMTMGHRYRLQAAILTAMWSYVPMAVCAADAPSVPAGHVHAGHGATRGAAMPWTRYPTLKVMVGGEGRQRRDVTLIPRNVVPVSVDAYASDPQAENYHRQLDYDLIEAKLNQPSAGGFFWLSAREEQADKVLVASTVYYLSERGSKNPTGMFMQQKNMLEIIPQPFPREHTRYRANENWKFLVRFSGQPLAQQNVHLITQNGSHAELVTDVKGMVSVRLPDDFGAGAQAADAGKHSHGRAAADFVLAAERVAGGKTYVTGFNSSYGPDAYAQRSLAMGLGFLLLGMMGATPLLRNRKAAHKDRSASGAVGKQEA